MTVDRSKFIGGSDAAVVLGVSPWRTPVELFFDKVAPEEEDPRERAAQLRRGQILEPVVRELLIGRLKDDGHDVKLLAVGKRYVDPEHSFLACEIDAEIMLDGEHCNVEIKTTRFRTAEWGRPGKEEEGEIPVYYTAQGMHGLMVTGRQICVFAALFGLDDMQLYFIPRVDDIIKSLRAREVDFWNNYVLAGTPPAPVNIDDIKRLFATMNGKPVEASLEVYEAIERVKELRQLARSFDDEKAQLEFDVAAHVCREWNEDEPVRVKDGKIIVPDRVDDAVLTFHGQPIATWKKQRGASLDQKRLKAEHPDLHESLMREHQFRVLRTKS